MISAQVTTSTASSSAGPPPPPPPEKKGDEDLTGNEDSSEESDTSSNEEEMSSASSRKFWRGEMELIRKRIRKHLYARLTRNQRLNIEQKNWRLQQLMINRSAQNPANEDLRQYVSQMNRLPEPTERQRTIDIREVVDEIPTTSSSAPAEGTIKGQEDDDEDEELGKLMDVALNNDSQSIHALILRYGALHLMYGQSNEAALDILAAHLDHNPIDEEDGRDTEEEESEEDD